MKTRLAVALAVCTWSVYASAADAAKLDTEEQKIGYTIGHQIGQDLKRSGMPIEVNALSQAIKDVLSGAKPAMTEAEMKTAMEALQAKQMKAQTEIGEKNKKAGEAFLEANKKKEGVVVLPSGMQYKVLTKGTGKKPTAKDTVSVNYRGTLIDGKEFDSSYTRGQPATFPVSGVIKGWQDLLPMMPVGSKWQVFIPADLAYGARGAGPDIGSNSTLVFDIELLEIKKAE